MCITNNALFMSWIYDMLSGKNALSCITLNMISYRETCYNLVMYSVWLCVSYFLSNMILLLFANNHYLEITACSNGKTSYILRFISCEPSDTMFGEQRSIHILLFNEKSSV